VVGSSTTIDEVTGAVFSLERVMAQIITANTNTPTLAPMIAFLGTGRA
jgi:hypothetical protein